MNYTDLNTIFTWFEEGDFPTAPQFQATFSSFYHKGENIPMAKVEGLGNALGKYVLAETFSSHVKDERAHEKHLVKLDASNISEEYRTALRAALGVGDLPDNIATTDYVDQNAKNIGNAPIVSDVNGSFTQGANWEHDTAGFNYYMKGLADKSNDTTFDKKIVIDTNGNVQFADRQEVVINLPDEFNSNSTNSTLTVNHVYPNDLPTITQDLQDIYDIMNSIYQHQLTPLQASDWNIINSDTGVDETQSVFENSLVKLRNSANNKGRTETYTSAISRTFSKDEDWIISLEVEAKFNHYGYFQIGLTQSLNIDLSAVFSTFIKGTGMYGKKLNNGSQPQIAIPTAKFKVYIIHKNNIINVVLIDENSNVRKELYANLDAFGDYRIITTLNSISQNQNMWLNVKSSYKIL